MERVVKGLVPLVIIIVAGLLIFATDDETSDRAATEPEIAPSTGAEPSAGRKALTKASVENTAAASQSRPRDPASSTTTPSRSKKAAKRSASPKPAEIKVASRAAAPETLSKPQRRYVKANKLNIRNAPKTGDVVARARKGDSVRVYARDGGWARVSTGSASAHWVAERLLSKSRPAVDYRVITAILKVRTAPQKGKIVATAKRGERLRVYAVEKRWARISPDDSPGRWVSLDYLSRDKLPAEFYVSAKVLNLRAAPKTGKVVQRVERGSAVQVYSVQDGWARLTKSKKDARWASLEFLSQTRAFE